MKNDLKGTVQPHQEGFSADLVAEVIRLLEAVLPPEAAPRPALDNLAARMVKLTYDRVRGAEAQYRQIFEEAVEGIFQSTPDGKLIMANPALARMFGYDEVSEMLGRNVLEVYVNPADREHWRQQLERDGAVLNREMLLRRRDGRLIWVRENARVVRDAHGRALYYEGTIVDITEQRRTEEALRQSEEQYRDLVENSRDLICTHDLRGRILSVNRAAAKLLGYDPKDFVGKKNIRDILAPEFRHQFDSYLTTIRREGVASGLMVVQTSSEERRVWEYHNTLRTEGVKAPIVRGMAHDITDRWRTGKELGQRNRHLSVLNNVSTAVSASLNVREITEILAEQLVGQMAFKIVFVWDYQELERTARLLAIYPQNRLLFDTVEMLGFDLHQVVVPFRGEDNPVYAQLLRGQDWVGTDFAEITEPTIPATLARMAQKGYGVKAIHNAPIMSKGKLVGSIVVGSERALISDAERALVLAAAAQVAPAIENARLYEEARREWQHSLSLMEVTSAINSTMSVDELLDLIVDKVLELTGSNHGSLFLLDEAGEVLTIRASRGFSPEVIQLAQFKKGEGLVGWVAESGQGVLLRNVEADPRFKHLPQQERYSAMIEVPMILNGTVVGVLSVDRLQGEKPFTEAEFRIAQNFANQAALALAKARLFEAAQTELVERKRAEAALRESEQRYRTLVETARDVIYTVSTDGRITSLNPAFETVTGWSRAECVGTHFASLLHPDDLPLAWDMFQRLLQGEMPPLYELRVRSRSGGYVVGEFRSTPQLRAGKVAGVLGVVRDITARKQAEDALRYRQEFENLLTAIATHFINLAIEEIDRGISQALKTIGEFAGVDRSYIFLFSDDGATMSNTHEWCADGVESYIEQLQGLPVDTFSWVLQPIRRFETIQIPRVADLPPEAAVEKEEFQREGIQSLISVPLVYGGSVIGFLGFDSVRAEKTWTEDSISLLKIAGEMLVNALARKRAEEVLRRRTEQLAALHEIDLEISAERDLTQLLDIVVQRTAGLLAASKYSIYIYDDDRAALRIAASLDEHFIGISLREGEGLAGRVAVTGQPLAVEDYMQWEGKAAVFDAEGFGPALAAPLKWQGTVLGVLSLARNRGERSFSPDDMDILEQVAAQAAIALHQARLFEEVRAARERLQTLSRRLIEVQEMERRTIARELHDEIGQALTAVKINLQAVQRLPDAAAFAPRLEDSMSIIERTLQQVRTLSLDLRPSMLDDLGLVSALRWYVDRQAQRTGVVAQFTADPLDARLPPELETTCFRVAQEALTNVARHAQARHVNVRLRQREAELELVVEDDGSGFDVPAARARAARGVSMGLLGMEERVLLVGGRIDITSAPGRGTEVRARFPLKEITA